MNFFDGVIFDVEDNVVLVDFDNYRILVYLLNGEVIWMFCNDDLRNLWGFCMIRDGSIVVCSGGEKREV